MALEEIDVKVLDPTNTQSADMNSSSPSLRIEEALNMKTLSSNDSYESPQKTSQPIAFVPPPLPPFLPGVANSPGSTGSLGSPILVSPIKELPKNANAKKFDIDSLNEVKRDVALQSKKLEITNHIFDLLIGEIKEKLFPSRKAEDVSPIRLVDESSPSPVSKKKKKATRATRNLRKLKSK